MHQPPPAGNGAQQKKWTGPMAALYMLSEIIPRRSIDFFKYVIERSSACRRVQSFLLFR